ncbi:MAG: PRC and DUF2382 domain-containing protein [Actinomycetota bacterium]
MISNDQITQISGTTVHSVDGEKIGKAGQVYLDDSTGQPSWVTVNTGLFGTSESFIPLQDATFEGQTLTVPYAKDKVKDAPRVADDGHLEPSEEDSLYSYYDMAGTGQVDENRTAGFDEDRTAGLDENRTAGFDQDAPGTVGHDTSGPTTDRAMTRSEEQLNVGTQKVETGRARLRKHVVTEQQTVTVPVEREEVRLEREPITDANRGAANEGPAISEEEHEVVLTEERVVVSKETVPVERVRLDKETVTEQKSVTEDVRKEQIDLNDGEQIDAERNR